MPTTEIPREEWVKFFDMLSKEHEGRVVIVELVGRKLGDQPESTRLPLVGMSADVKGPEKRIEVTVGGRPDAHLTHIINAPRRVWFKPAIGTADEAIEIESEDEATTLVHFPYVPPEQGERQLPGR
jgi:Family of unknown function (DUF5335)